MSLKVSDVFNLLKIEKVNGSVVVRLNYLTSSIIIHYALNRKKNWKDFRLKINKHYLPIYTLLSNRSKCKISLLT